MDRLTERTSDGILVKEDYGEDVLKTLYQCYGAEPMPHYANCDEGYCAMEKLAEYEDTGLTPEEIMSGEIFTGWIPVEERLPEQDGIYLAVFDGEIAGENKPFVGMAEFEKGKWIDDEEDYQCIIAWMPLPEPYRPEK